MRALARFARSGFFHLAVHGAYSWETDWEQMVQTNIQGTMSLVSACLKTGFEAFVNTASSSEYGFKASRALRSGGARNRTAITR